MGIKKSAGRPIFLIESRNLCLVDSVYHGFWVCQVTFVLQMYTFLFDVYKLDPPDHFFSVHFIMKFAQRLDPSANGCVLVRSPNDPMMIKMRLCKLNEVGIVCTQYALQFRRMVQVIQIVFAE